MTTRANGNSGVRCSSSGDDHNRTSSRPAQVSFSVIQLSRPFHFLAFLDMTIRLFVFALPLCLFSTLAAQAQLRELSIEAAYPLPIGDTFLSQYDGRAGASVMLGQPLSERLSLRVGVQYNRLHWDRAGTDANVYTPRAGLAYSLAISERLTLNPEAGLSYSRFAFQFDADLSSAERILNGGGFWISLSPRYRTGERWAIGVAAEYRATFMEQSDEVLDTPFNREYHALVFGLVGTFRF